MFLNTKPWFSHAAKPRGRPGNPAQPRFSFDNTLRFSRQHWKKKKKLHHSSHIRLIRWTLPVSRDIGEHIWCFRISQSRLSRLVWVLSTESRFPLMHCVLKKGQPGTYVFGVSEPGGGGGVRDGRGQQASVPAGFCRKFVRAECFSAIP